MHTQAPCGTQTQRSDTQPSQARGKQGSRARLARHGAPVNFGVVLEVEENLRRERALPARPILRIETLSSSILRTAHTQRPSAISYSPLVRCTIWHATRRGAARSMPTSVRDFGARACSAADRLANSPPIRRIFQSLHLVDVSACKENEPLSCSRTPCTRARNFFGHNTARLPIVADVLNGTPQRETGAPPIECKRARESVPERACGELANAGLAAPGQSPRQ